MTQPLIRWPSWIGVVVEDLDVARRFYGDVLGFHQVEATEEYVQFDMGDERTFELLAKDPSTPQYTERRYQVGFDVEDIRVARDELIGRGVEPISDIEGGSEAGSLWAYFRDPEGNVFEITQRLG
jgi:catechol 2,3-dioxygenase-like lactoylglutathione lyase family enzyme